MHSGRNSLRLVVLCLAALAASACTMQRDTQPVRSASEQLIISTAIERAVAQLKFEVPAGTRVFVETAYFDGYDNKYATGTVRDRLLREGVRLVPDRGAADAVVELRAGALSVDERAILLGIPSFELPVPLAGQAKTPELALFKKADRLGVAKIAATTFDAKTGALIKPGDPEYGFSHRTRYTVLLLISWTTTDVRGERSTNDLID
jgi:hypothetical protein